MSAAANILLQGKAERGGTRGKDRNNLLRSLLEAGGQAGTRTLEDKSHLARDENKDAESRWRTNEATCKPSMATLQR